MHLCNYLYADYLLCESQKVAVFYRYTRSAYCWKQEAQVDFIITQKNRSNDSIDSMVVQSEDILVGDGGSNAGAFLLLHSFLIWFFFFLYKILVRKSS